MMIRSVRWMVAALCCAFVLACKQEDNRPRHVVFLGFDGLTARAVERVNTPNLDRMKREGSWTCASRSILPSSSACNWRSIFACSAPEQHGFNNWNSQKPAMRPSVTLANGQYPDLFSVLRAQRADATSAYLYDWGGMAFTADTNACSLVRRAFGNEQMTKAVCELIAAGLPTFTAAAFANPDGVGHKFGFDSPEYDACVAEVDGYIGRILKALEDAHVLDETVLIVSSDHGGTGKKHGGATLEEMERPVFVFGKGIRRGCHLGFGGTVYDTGATMAALLGLKAPREWIGRPLDEAFAR